MSSWKLEIEGDTQRIIRAKEKRCRHALGMPRILFIPVEDLWTRILRPALVGHPS